MAVSEFLLNINWAFNLSRQSKQTMKEAKLGMDDINKGVENFNRLNSNAKNSNRNMSASIVNSVGDIRESFNDLNIGASENLKNLAYEYDNFRDSGYSAIEAVEELKKLHGEFSQAELGKVRLSMNSLADDIRGVSQSFEESTKSTYNFKNVAKESAQESILNSLAQAEAWQKTTAAINTTSSAVSKFRNYGIIGENDIKQAEVLRDKLLDVNKELSSQPLKIEEINKAINNMDFSNLNPRQVEEMTRQYANLHDAIARGDTSEEIAKMSYQLNRTREGFEKNAAAAEKFKSEMRGLGQILTGPLTRAVALAAVFQDSMNAQTKATRDIAQLNIRSAENVSAAQEGMFRTQMSYNQAMLDAGAATGSSLDRVQSTMNNLANLRVSDTAEGLGELAEIGLQMEYAFGLSEGASAELLKSMKLIGGMGADEIRNSMDALAGVQDSMGLTTEAAREVASTVGTVVRQMNALGGAMDVTTVTREIGRMTSAFESVGLSAQDASGMINKLMDPDQLASNTLLLSKMGMTASDALAMMSGDGSQMEGMTRQMVQAARDLKNQYGGNIYALKAMAEQHGMSLSMVQQLSQYDEQRIRDMEEENKLTQQATDARRGMNEAISQLGAQLNILMAQVVLPLVNLLSWMLKPVIGLIQGFNSLGSEAEGFGKAMSIVGKTLAGILVTLTVIAGPRVMLSILRSAGGIFKVVTGLGGAVGGLAGKLGGLVSGPFKKLGDMSTSIFNKSQSAIDSAASAASKGTGTLTKRIREFGRAIRTIPAKQILAIGAAMLMLGAAISMVVMSIVQLVRAVGDADLGFTQLAGIALILLPVFVGFIAILKTMPPIILALGKAGAGAAPGLLALGASMLMIAGSVWIIINGMTTLMTVMAETGTTIGQMATIMGTTLGIFLVFMLAVVGLGYLAIGAVPGLLALSGAMFAVGVAAVMIGFGVKMILDSMANLVNVLASLGSDTIGPVVSALSAMASSLIKISLAALIFAGAMYLMVAASAGFVVAIGIMAASLAFLFLLGAATNNLAENISMMGTGMKLMAESANGAKDSLQGLKEALSDFEVPEGFNKMGRSFLMLGITAKAFGEDILMLGTGVLHLGAGLKLMNENAAGMTEGVSSIKSGLRDLMGMDLSQLISTFQTLGEATTQVARNFQMMGEGISIMSQGLDVVVQQLENMIGVLSNDNLVGLSDSFNTEMAAINNAMQPSMAAGPQVQTITEMGSMRAESVRETSGGVGTGAVVSELQTANTHLESMDSNIQNILNFMKDNKNSGGTTINSSTQVSLGR